jgi:oligopeptide transport system substrate-binding protein
MKKTMAIVLSVIMVVTILGGCSSTTDSSTSTGTESGTTTSSTTTETIQAPDTTTTSDSEEAHTDANAITDLVMWATAEADTFNCLNTENGTSAFLSTLYDCWLGKDVNGEIIGLLADDYSANEDSTVWTFHLRDGVTWVDNQLNYKADVTVYDFLTSAEYILNYHKNSGNNASMLTNNVAGAMDYYNYTKELSAEEAYALTYEDAFSTMVGIVADEDAGTVTYTCKQPTPYFWSVASHKSTSPLAAGVLEEVGVENYNGVSCDDLWSCGAYIITECIPNNTKTLSKNTSYWNYGNIGVFDTVTIKIIESVDVGFQLFANGEIDQIQLGESALVNILSDSSNEFYNYVTKEYQSATVYTMYFNYNKNKEDGTPDTNWNTAIDNENFRMAMYWGLDLAGYYSRTDPITPYSVAGYTFTQSQLCNIDGEDYQDYVIDLLGLEKSNDYDSRYDVDKAQEYLDKAIEELTAAGVTFPIEFDYYIAGGNQTQLDTATVLKSAFEGLFGEYMDFEIKTYVSSFIKEIAALSYQSGCIYQWSADYDDPSNCIEQASMTAESNAFMSLFINMDERGEGEAYELFSEFTDMCFAANAITDDLNERYRAYAEAEAFMIEHNLCMPMVVNVKWQLTRINDYSKSVKGRLYQGWETNSEMYSTADYNTFAAEKAGE